MCKKTKKYILLSVLGVYLVGFFALPPIAMTATTTQNKILIRTTHRINDLIYYSWIKHLSKDNIIAVTWSGNILFWCEKFDVCQVGKPSNT